MEKFGSYEPDEFCCLVFCKASNEDNYIRQKFANVVLKTNNIDHCAKLCQSSSVVA
ncbi:MAG: hypothetical protein ABR985_15880 [Methanotrichaceae archaeon]